MENLIDKINLVFNEEKRIHLTKSYFGSFNINRLNLWIKGGEVKKLISDKPSLDIIKSSSFDILFKLFNSLNNPDKEKFINILMSHLLKDSPYFNVSYLSFFTLYRIGKILEAIEYAKENSTDSNYEIINMLKMLSKIIESEYSYISPEVLEKIKTILDEDIEIVIDLAETINSAQLAYLSKELEENNLEINEDKETLKKTFRRYNFPSDLSETLDKIDKILNTASDKFEYKQCMDLIRSFTEIFYKTIAMAIDQENGNKMDEKDSAKVSKFFIEKGLISDDQGKILVSLRHFLSNFASHRLKSKAEDARLSKNMAIEFCLYITRKYEDIIENKKN